MTFRLIKILLISTLLLSMTKHKKQSITIIRGLEPSISHFNALEQKFILKIAKKLEDNGYPLDQLTRVDLKKTIADIKDYYSYNEITFFINPGIYEKGNFGPKTQNIGVDWEDPSVIRHPDGSIEFEVGKRVKPEDLVMNLYRLQDHYPNYPLIKNHDLILQKINDALVATDIEEIQNFASKGIMELIKNYEINIESDSKNDIVYKLSITRLDHNMIDSKYFFELYKTYNLNINIETLHIEIISSFDPTFFPTPSPMVLPENKN